MICDWNFHAYVRDRGDGDSRFSRVRIWCVVYAAILANAQSAGRFILRMWTVNPKSRNSPLQLSGSACR